MQDAEGKSLKGLAEIIIAKHRNGSVGDLQLKFKTELAKFTDMEEDFLEGFDSIDEGAVTMGSKMNTKESEKYTEDLLQHNSNLDDAF